MIQFPSDTSRNGQGHVAGSQQAADNLIARNCKRAAKQRRNIHVVLTGAMLEAIVLACLGAMILAGIVAARGGLR